MVIIFVDKASCGRLINVFGWVYVHAFVESSQVISSGSSRISSTLKGTRALTQKVLYWVDFFNRVFESSQFCAKFSLSRFGPEKLETGSWTAALRHQACFLDHFCFCHYFAIVTKTIIACFYFYEASFVLFFLIFIFVSNCMHNVE